MDIYCLRISIVECIRMDIPAWISMWIPTLVWIIEDWHPKIMNTGIYDVRGFSEILWICYGFSNQGPVVQPKFTHPKLTWQVSLTQGRTLFNIA